MTDNKRKVFVSHSSVDKPYVERIVKELESRNVRVWFDKYEIGVGDSIVQEISQGLANADYFLLVLSPNSVKSHWVQVELNAALMEETSKKGIVVLPAVIENCEIPILLKDRIYADFRTSFEDGLNGLLRVLNHEAVSALSSEPTHRTILTSSDCKSKLSNLSLADLRGRLTPPRTHRSRGRSQTARRGQGPLHQEKRRGRPSVRRNGEDVVGRALDGALAAENRRGAERVFDWLFYNQGTGNYHQASSDTFINAALRWFGDPDPIAGSLWDRGARLAKLVGKAYPSQDFGKTLGIDNTSSRGHNNDVVPERSFLSCQ